MSRASMMKFAEDMLASSVFLQENCRKLEEFRDPECCLPICMLGYFGQKMAKNYDSISSEEWTLLSGLIEQGLASEDDDIGTAVATGLIESLVHCGEDVDGLWPRIEAALGPLASEYADAYRHADFMTKPG